MRLGLVVVKFRDDRLWRDHVSALPIDDRPSLRYFLWGRGVRAYGFPSAGADLAQLFATVEEARAAADEIAETGFYSDFAIYVIARGKLRRISSAEALQPRGRTRLAWVVDPG